MQVATASASCCQPHVGSLQASRSDVKLLGAEGGASRAHRVQRCNFVAPAIACVSWISFRSVARFQQRRRSRAITAFASVKVSATEQYGPEEDELSVRRRGACSFSVAALTASPACFSSSAASAAVVPSTVCLGTCCLEGEASTQQVLAGLKVGYRWIDTASHYGNETNVAEAIRKSGLMRSEVYIVTKVWFDDMGDATAGNIDESLKRLKTDYVDLLLVHFPGTTDVLQDPTSNKAVRQKTWAAFEAAKSAGKARQIGVANFCRRHLKELLGYCKIKPAVNQLEIHPYFQNSDLIDYCLQSGVQPMAFSPLAHGELKLLENRTLVDIARAHQCTPAQIALRWLLDQNITPVMFSTSPERLRENFGALDFALTADERQRILLLDKGRDARVGYDPNLIA